MTGSPGQLPCPGCGHPAEHHDGDWDCAGCLNDNQGGVLSGRGSCNCELSESKVYEESKRCASCGHQKYRHDYSSGCKLCECGEFVKSDSTTCTDCPHTDIMHYLSTYGESLRFARRKIRLRCLVKDCDCGLFQGAARAAQSIVPSQRS